MQKVISPMCVDKGELLPETPRQAWGCARVILEESGPPLQISLIKPKTPAMEDVAKSSNYERFFISSFYWETYKTFISSSAKYERWEVQNLPSKPGFCHYSCLLPPCPWMCPQDPVPPVSLEGKTHFTTIETGFKNSSNRSWNAMAPVCPNVSLGILTWISAH